MQSSRTDWRLKQLLELERMASAERESSSAPHMLSGLFGRLCIMHHAYSLEMSGVLHPLVSYGIRKLVCLGVVVTKHCERVCSLTERSFVDLAVPEILQNFHSLDTNSN